MKVKLTLEYLGSAFSGWQIQDGLCTVQGELERAIEIYLTSLAKRLGIETPFPVTVIGSGRTDAGVHARGQVASFAWPESLPFDACRLKEAINGISHRELVVLDVEQAPDSFDARLSPHIKCYSYSLLLRKSASIDKGLVWPVGEKLNICRMIQAAAMLEGQRDFSSFRAKDCSAKSTVRTIGFSEFSRPRKDLLLYFIHGKGFLKQMVRIIVGTLVEVGYGRMGLDEFEILLQSQERVLAGPTAPPQGLVLEWVRYESPPD